MGFFKDIDKGNLGNDGSFNAEEMLGGLDDISIDDAFSSMEGTMSGEEALAFLDDDYVKEIEEIIPEEDIIGISDTDELHEEVVTEEAEEIVEDTIDEFKEPEAASEEGVEEEVAEEAAEEAAESEEIDLPDMVVPEDFEPEIAEKKVDEFETTVITKGTTIRGGITSDCSLDVMGVITGDVECLGKLRIYGTVSGNTSASEIYIETPQKLNGDLISTGDVIVSEDSVIVGTIQASSAHISGAVKGDIDVEDNIIIASSAVVYGNITAKTMMIEVGAVVHGICNIGSDDKDLSEIFGE